MCKFQYHETYLSPHVLLYAVPSTPTTHKCFESFGNARATSYLKCVDSDTCSVRSQDTSSALALDTLSVHYDPEHPLDSAE